MSKTTWNEVDEKTGTLNRTERTFRSTITADGSSGFKAEADRYHLYVSHACPWAHRTLIVRKLKGLEKIISVDVVDWLLVKGTGWTLTGNDPGSTADTVNGFEYLKDLYLSVEPNYTQSVTVPVLYDKKTKQIVNNESSEIIRMLNSEFNEFSTNISLDLYPKALRSTIDEVNSWIYTNINNGVYKCGFATRQDAYDSAVTALFDHLEKAEKLLSGQRYLAGNTFTEADVRFFTTLVRFDPVYVTHFKCNKKRLTDFPNLLGYTRDIYQSFGIGDTVNMQHIKNHYFLSHTHINPFSIVPVGLEIDYTLPHSRAQLSASK